MTRIERDFTARPDEEQTWMIQNTWCDACREADLGLTSPREYEEDGHVYVEGKCRKCGRSVRTEVIDMDVD